MPNYFKNIFNALLAMSKSILGWLILGLSQLLSIGHIKMGAWMLLALFITDFVTGVIASFYVKKSQGVQTSIYDFESGKVRLSLVKALTYILIVLLSWFFYLYMFDKPLPMPGSTKSFTVPEIVLGICNAIEAWSIIENVKKLGFDIFQILGRIGTAFWDTVRKIKHG